MEEEFYKRCEGCLSYSKVIGKPRCSLKRISYIREELTCPCSICLVKGVCNTDCEEFIKFCRGLELSVYPDGE